MTGRVTRWELSTSASFKDFPPDDVRKVLLTTTRTLEHQHADICFPRKSVCVSSILPYFPHFPVVELRKLLSVLPSLAPPCHFSLRFQRAAPIFFWAKLHSPANIHIVHAFVFYCIFPIRLYIFPTILRLPSALKAPKKKNRKTLFSPPKLKRDFPFSSPCLEAPHSIVLHTFCPSRSQLGSIVIAIMSGWSFLRSGLALISKMNVLFGEWKPAGIRI